jgi:hypothetical protein
MAPIAALAFLVLATGVQEANRARVRGRFVDQGGRPVVEAAVWSRVWPGEDFTARSGADGSFEVVLQWPEHHRDTYYWCIVRAPGSARWEFEGELAPGQEFDLGTVRLEPGGTVTGRVFLGSMPQGHAQLLVVRASSLPPEPGWHFEACPASGPSFVSTHGPTPEYERPVDSSRSADDGTFRIVGLPAGRYGIWARCDASWWAATGAFEIRVAEEMTLPEIVLEPLPREHRIEGVVLDPDGAPVPGARVQASSVERRADCPNLVTTSAPDGRFQLHVLPLSCGPLELRASVEDGRHAPAAASPIEPGRSDLVLQLGRMQEVALRVVDTEGAPVEDYGWDLTLEDGSSTIWSGAPEEHRPGGLASIRFPSGQLRELTIVAGGFEDQLVPLETTSARELTVTLSGARPVVSGRVTAEGLPVGGAHVDLVRPDYDLVDDLVPPLPGSWHYCVKACATTDAAGLFRIPNEWPRDRYRVRAWAEGHAPAYSGEVQGATPGVELALTRGAALAGRVRLANAQDPTGLTLRAHRADGLDNLHCLVGRQFTARVRDDGTYRFEHLEPGAWLVVPELPPGVLQELGWSAQHLEECLATPHVFELTEDRTTTGDVLLETPGGICRLRGRLTVGDRIREGYAYVLLTGAQRLRIAFASVDVEGRFELTTRAPGRYRLVIHAGPGHHQYRLVTDLVTLTPGETVWERSLTLTEWKEEGVRLDRE